jgi:hypothetical protein
MDDFRKISGQAVWPARTDALQYRNRLSFYRSAVRNLLGTFTSISCALPSRMIVTFTLILSFAA